MPPPSTARFPPSTAGCPQNWCCANLPGQSRRDFHPCAWHFGGRAGLQARVTTQKFMDHRIRLALGMGYTGQMSGGIEVDETFIGGKARNMHMDVKKRESPEATL